MVPIGAACSGATFPDAGGGDELGIEDKWGPGGCWCGLHAPYEAHVGVDEQWWRDRRKT